MAAKSNQNVVTEDAGKSTTVTRKEPRYKIEKLRENSMQLFGVTVSTFDGAMYGHKETEMTIKEARAVIDKWLGRKG